MIRLACKFHFLLQFYDCNVIGGQRLIKLLVRKSLQNGNVLQNGTICVGSVSMFPQSNRNTENRVVSELSMHVNSLNLTADSWFEDNELPLKCAGRSPEHHHIPGKFDRQFDFDIKATPSTARLLFDEKRTQSRTRGLISKFGNWQRCNLGALLLLLRHVFEGHRSFRNWPAKNYQLERLRVLNLRLATVLLSEVLTWSKSALVVQWQELVLRVQLSCLASCQHFSQILLDLVHPPLLDSKSSENSF